MDSTPPSRPARPSASLTPLLRPSAIAIIGASATPGSLGAALLDNLQRMGFTGAIHLVNPHRSEIAGRPCLPTVMNLPFGIDCAVLAIPRAAVLEAIHGCAARAVKAVIIYAAGFAEEGPEGLALQQEIARIAAETGMVVEGPNCLGMVNYIEGAPLTFVHTPARRLTSKGVAIVSQSGAIAAMLSVSLHHRDIPLSFTVSTGNEASTGVEDYLEYMIDDNHTTVITIIAEHFRSPQRLLALAARAAATGKPIVLLHPGSSSEARASAATHTGAMVGNHEVMRVMTRAAGLIPVSSLSEALDTTELLARHGANFGTGLMLLTESGAFKALALDQCSALALPLPTPSPTATKPRRATRPPFSPPTNPLDLTAPALIDPSIYHRTLAALLEDPAYGTLMLAIILTDETTSTRKLTAITEAIKTLQPTKPIIVAGLDEGAAVPPTLINNLRALNIAFFSSAERVFNALAPLQNHRTPPKTTPPTSPPAARLPTGIIPEYRAKQYLQKLGLPIPPGQLAKTIEEALTIASTIGYPVVLKAQSQQISHKSDVGGVQLNLATPQALREGWRRLHDNLQTHHPAAPLDGVLVETMGKNGTELIIGAKRDPEWGTVLLAGFGGVMAETLQDFRLLPPGLDKPTIITELQKLKSAALLNGFRGSPPLDTAAIADIITQLEHFMQIHPEITEIDINPVILYPNGAGALALDALMRVA